MKHVLDKSALFDALEAYWTAGEAGTDKGVEAAIVAYLERMQSRRLRSDPTRSVEQHYTGVAGR